MRNAFVNALLERARTDEALFLAVGDLGYGVIDEFEAQLPQQFLNAGVAEQSMIGLSAGLAKSGRRVFAYSIANFPTFRAIEQVRNDVCYHKLPVTVVSVGAGLGYGVLGYSHFAVEDLAIMRALPNIEVYSPIDPIDTVRCLDEIILRGKPSYIRLGKGGEEQIYASGTEVSIGSTVLREGTETWVISTGSITANAIRAIDEIRNETGASIGVIAMNQIKPFALPAEISFENTDIFTIEEHVTTGGLRSALLEHFSDNGQRVRSVRGLGIEDPTAPVIGSQAFVRDFHGLSAEKIKLQVLDALS